MKTKTHRHLPSQHTKDLTVAVVGATGMVGQEFIKILLERKFPVGRLHPFASEKSSGSHVPFGSKKIKLEGLKAGCFKNCDVAFFSAGADVSREWGPRAVHDGAFVIDNSSAFRMNPDIPLVVPEVNPKKIPSRLKPSIIANPNCSTIQLVVALKPLQDAFGLKSVTVATYQSVSGAGRDGVDELMTGARAQLENKKSPPNKTFAHPIAFNNIPHIDKFDFPTGFTLEEKKVINETRKIMGLPKLPVSCTAVRTPTLNGHSEAVWVELKTKTTKAKFVKALKNSPGVVVQDDPQKNLYPLTRNASGKNEVFVGRIRRDLDNPKRWLLWIVSDNVRKGAALNGIQIAEELFRLG
jgi:aspartate-semialdehyde dehydrogenase